MSQDGHHHWIAISDLLSGFVVVLILLFVGSTALQTLKVESASERESREREETMRGIARALEPYVASGLVTVDEGEDRIRLNDTSFPSGSACLDPRAVAAIQSVAPEVAGALKAHADLTVYVEGHTDAASFLGTPTAEKARDLCGWFSDNTQLSTVRATAVRTILASHLQTEMLARVPVSGFGSEVLKDASDPYGAINRRVEIRIVWPANATR